jgi:hypothetical protein
MKTRQLFLTTTNILIGILTVQASALKIYFGNDFRTSSTKIIFSDGATSGFDSKLDKEYHKLPANTMNYIYSLAGEKHMLFENYRPKPENYSAIPLQIAVKEAGTFSFSLEDLTNDLGDLQFSLYDASTGKTETVYPGVNKQFIFDKTEINSKKNYVLHIFHAPVITSSPVSCYESKNGIITISFNDIGEWEAKLRTAPGQAIQAKGSNGKASFNDLGAGVYFVEIWKGKTKITESIVSVNRPSKLNPKFSVKQDTLTAGEKLFAENLSPTGERWYWEFGDNTDSKQFSPSHVYETPGTYTLTLTTSNEAGCTSSVSGSIYVEPKKNPALVQQH